MARTANEYTSMITAKEQQAERLATEVEKTKMERDTLLREITELQAKIDTLTAELESERKAKERNASSQVKLQAELDELRALLEAKVTEETRRSEVAKSKEEELGDLRSQVAKLSADLTETRRVAAETQNKLKVELETLAREHKNIQHSHSSLSDRAQASQAQLKKTEAALSEAEKAKRALESELQRRRVSSASSPAPSLAMPISRTPSCSWNAIKPLLTVKWKHSRSSLRLRPPSARSWRRPRTRTRQKRND
ncbi:hypothetical protein OH77DRAFT_533487 [Trametes cingulata]|nr:hypothetical protein OH77DRAFT_533487 [Trametes cingulata]